MLLNLVLAVPIFSGLAAYLMRQSGAKSFAALIASVQTLLAIYLGFTGYPQGISYSVEWLPQFGLYWSLGLDGANFLLVLLTPVITWLAILATPDDTPKLASYVASLLLLDGFLSGLFLSQNLGLFYIFFEAMLLPALVLIAGWSKVDAGKTALKFLIYTMVGLLRSRRTLVSKGGNRVDYCWSPRAGFAVPADGSPPPHRAISVCDVLFH